jgi:hypothetical protein
MDGKNVWKIIKKKDIPKGRRNIKCKISQKEEVSRVNGSLKSNEMEFS